MLKVGVEPTRPKATRFELVKTANSITRAENYRTIEARLIHSPGIVPWGYTMTVRSWSDQDFQQAIQDNQTIAGVARQLGLSTSPGNYRSIHRHVERLNLDTTHMLGQAHLRGKQHKHRGFRELESILVERSHYSSGALKKRLIKNGLIPDVCALCGQVPYWNGKPLTLQLDHINGNYLDNRLENLQILCPNCHTQTDTFTSRKGGGRYSTPKQEPLIKRCPCGTEIWRRSNHCEKCQYSIEVYQPKHKIAWPPIETLRQMVEDSNYLQVGKKLGVSDNAVRKHLHRYGATGR